MTTLLICSLLLDAFSLGCSVYVFVVGRRTNRRLDAVRAAGQLEAS